MTWEEIRHSAEVHGFLRRLVEDSDHVDGLWLIPPDGRTANSADFFPFPEVDASSRAYFQALEAADELHFGEMIVGKLKGKPELQSQPTARQPDRDLRRPDPGHRRHHLFCRLFGNARAVLTGMSPACSVPTGRSWSAIPSSTAYRDGCRRNRPCWRQCGRAKEASTPAARRSTEPAASMAMPASAGIPSPSAMANRRGSRPGALGRGTGPERHDRARQLRHAVRHRSGRVPAERAAGRRDGVLARRRRSTSRPRSTGVSAPRTWPRRSRPCSTGSRRLPGRERRFSTA